jgi:hypothetical protein
MTKMREEPGACRDATILFEPKLSLKGECTVTEKEVLSKGSPGIIFELSRLNEDLAAFE